MAGLAPRCVELIRHPGSAKSGIVRRVDVEISAAADGGLRLRYFVDGDIPRLAVPAPVPSQPADGLWRHTCFEAFVAGQGSTAYCEFNFSTSGEWAMYGFTRYREGMAPLGRALPPRVAASVTDDRIALEAVIPREILLGPPGGTMLRLGLAAVLEGSDGALSYWALAHPGDRPDFHDPAGFVLEIERDLPW